MTKISSKLQHYLDKNKYKYDIIEHRTTYTAWDTAQTEKVKPQEVAKALVMAADKDHIIALLPSNRNTDKKKLLKIINVLRKKQSLKAYGKIDLAKEVWMKKNILGKVGAVPPFSGLLKIPVYLDNLLAKNKKIYVGSGEYDASIRVNTAQYIKIENSITGSFSIKKK
jgi:prolyl-tRNA editing enzyme YbaK/EbsC (Cys-tRNA(Pro) deacylase)